MAKTDAVDFFYLSTSEIEDPSEGRQGAPAERPARGADGLGRLPDRPWRGATVDPARFEPQLVDLGIKPAGRVPCRAPEP